MASVGRPKREIVNGEYQCNRCSLLKPVSEFYPDKITSSGLRGRCKKCDMEIINSRHTNNLERALRNVCIRHRTNGKNGSDRRKRFTDEGCITPEILRVVWDVQDGKCAITGKPMTHIQGSGAVMTNVSLDRIDNGRGYTRDNVRLVCRAANFIKSTLSDTEMFDWCKSVLDGPLARK